MRTVWIQLADDATLVSLSKHLDTSTRVAKTWLLVSPEGLMPLRARQQLFCRNRRTMKGYPVSKKPHCHEVANYLVTLVMMHPQRPVFRKDSFLHGHGRNRFDT